MIRATIQADKGANIKDVQDFMVTVPTLEYHNCNWTWADMLMEIKKVYKQHIIQKVSVITFQYLMCTLYI